MAMLPFCGYNMADYWAHWLRVGASLKNPPRIFHVNWFKQDANGKFLWPGFGENLRVLRWVADRCRGAGAAVESPIGFLPTEDALDATGLDLPPGAMRELLGVDPADWRQEAEGLAEFFAKFGDRLPPEMERQRQELLKRLG
jgi:phosphoenolpyruvate carboxykinase (GTP)